MAEDLFAWVYYPPRHCVVHVFLCYHLYAFVCHCCMSTHFFFNCTSAWVLCGLRGTFWRQTLLIIEEMTLHSIAHSPGRIACCVLPNTLSWIHHFINFTSIQTVHYSSTIIHSNYVTNMKPPCAPCPNQVQHSFLSLFLIFGQPCVQISFNALKFISEFSKMPTLLSIGIPHPRYIILWRSFFWLVQTLSNLRWYSTFRWNTSNPLNPGMCLSIFLFKMMEIDKNGVYLDCWLRVRIKRQLSPLMDW